MKADILFKDCSRVSTLGICRQFGVSEKNAGFEKKVDGQRWGFAAEARTPRLSKKRDQISFVAFCKRTPHALTQSTCKVDL